MYSPHLSRGSILFVCLCLALTAGCKPSDAELPPGASPADEVGRELGDLELPVSLRTGGTAPGAAARLEATDEQLRVDGQPVVELERGRVADADKRDGIIPKLADKLRAPARQTLALRLQANLPYETMALAINTAAQAGVHELAIQVRKTGASSETGWLTIPGFVTSAKADALPAIPGLSYMSWNAFTDQWQAVFDGCRSSKNGNCAYVNGNIADGGTLRTELFASGRGINVNFFRRGLTAEQEAEETTKREQQLAAKKEDFLQGRISREDLEELILLGHPSTYALFQFRYAEALSAPSALTKTIAPVCHAERCGIVVTSTNVTEVLKVVSMIGAAFPDGTPLPALAFELPWTEKPKPADLEAFIAQQQAQ
jgi:hypothetical protein